MRKEKGNIWQAIGIIALLALIVYVIKQLNAMTSTKLYDDEAIKKLDDDNTYKEVYKEISKLKTS